ncbi:MAG: MlaD family protein [Burkholderiales bacterium]|nr:MlaD family protein [Burkholderiales bacterium]
MSGKKVYISLGIFVFVGIALALVGIGLLVGPRLFQPASMVETYFIYSISGLEVGSPVKFRGIEVGQVREIALSSEAYPEAGQDLLTETHSLAVVRLELYMKPEELQSELTELVAKGLRIQTQLAGITGSLYLSVEFLDPKKYPASRITYDWTPKYSVIPSAPSLSNEVVENVKNFLADLDDMHIQDSLQETIPAFNSLLKNLDRLSGSVNPNLINNIGSTLSNLLKTADNKLTQFDVQQVNGLIDQIQGAMKDFETMAAKTQATALIQSLTNLSNRLSTMLGSNQYDVTQILTNIGRVSQNLQGLIRELSNNPGALFSRTRQASPRVLQ